MKVRTGVGRLLRRIPAGGPEHDALSALAVMLATALDDDPPASAAPNLARELRATIAALTRQPEGDGGELEELLRDVRR